MIRKFAASVIILSLAAVSLSEEVFPNPEWEDALDPLASQNAIIGGSLSTFAGQYPQSFNYYLAQNTFCAQLFSLMYETLIDMDPISMEYIPGIADKWTLSDDKRTFTFHINPAATWSDGKPITSKDVAWTYDAIMDPKNSTGTHKVALDRFSPPEIIDEQTVSFTAKEVHWQNLGAVGGFFILPAHAFEKKDFNDINFEFPVVSGPYMIDNIDEGNRLDLIRRSNWWQGNALRHRNKGNFQTLTFLFFAERGNAFEAFRKGLIDIFPVHTSRLWVKETRDSKFINNWIIKQKVQNYQPVGFQGFAMNMRRPPFNDVRVRKAMAHLLDRDRLNRTLMYNQYFLHRSYYEDLYSPDNPCRNPLFNYDPARAEMLLASAGWKANPNTGLLEKDGQTFTFTFLARSPTSEPFLQVYNEDLEKVGIRLTIESKDWAAWARDMNEFNFDMTWAAWSAGLFKNPESMWHSKEATRASGNNITGFQSEQADELIEMQKTIFNVEPRHAICRKIDSIITAQCPYVLLWNINYSRLLYWNKFGTPPTVLSKYGNADAAIWYWWQDEDSVSDLEYAVANNLPLPPHKPVVVFDKEFRTP